ncbi:MAG: hypothetical protein JO217_00085 [Acidobacteriaceae bacterium]|nr:hypothetical protein [Acidobacteriaceae bacterium]
MTRSRKVAFSAGAAAFCLIAAGLGFAWYWYKTRPTPNTVLIGAVLRQARDARSQTPIAGVAVMASSGSSTAQGRSDLAGLFRLTLSPGVKPPRTVTLSFRRAGYEPLEVTISDPGRIYIARLAPISSAGNPAANESDIVIGDPRVRYSVKTTATQNIGSFARAFEVFNTGNILCNGRPPCSPDGKWKAATTSVTYDAGGGNEFRDPRVSCIAGPCPFATANVSNLGRTLRVSALDWSDTTTFFVEAEVIRTQTSDMVRYAFPVVFGNGMNFTLPGTAGGPSIEADVNGQDIVFPVGPDMRLSWATCTLEANADGSKLYRCQLKPGYRFR